MKLNNLAIHALMVFSSCALAFSQSSPPQRTYIPGDLTVSPFTPPPPPVPMKMPTLIAEATTVIPQADGTKLTIIRTKPSTLPKTPAAAPVPQQSAQTPTLATQNHQQARRHLLQVGATIYGQRVSLVNWQHPDTGESYEAICGFNLSLLEGIGEFVSAGETYSFMMMHTASSIDHLTEVTNQPIADGSIQVIRGNAQDPAGMASVTLLKELIAAEKSRLITYQAARAVHQKAAAAWAKANPTKPQDQTIWFTPLH